MAASAPTHFDPPPLPLGPVSRGKVRDIYTLGDTLALVATDRISAFDRNLGHIPGKGALLTQLSAHWFGVLGMPHHLIECPHSNVSLVHRTQVIPVEFVVRGYLAGSLWRSYGAGKDEYDLHLEAGLSERQKLPRPVVTPTHKAAVGEHDEPTTRAQLIASNILTASDYDSCAALALELYARGSAYAAERGLILADTKYEFGWLDGSIIAIDEIHTPDSSRYWDMATGTAQFDKEPLRQWLRTNGFDGAGQPPPLPFEVTDQLFQGYVRAFQLLTGQQSPRFDGIDALKVWADQIRVPV